MLKQKKSSKKSMALYALSLPVVLVVGLSFLPYNEGALEDRVQIEISGTSDSHKDADISLDTNRVVASKIVGLTSTKNAPPLESALTRFILNNDHTLMTVDSHETDFDITVYNRYGEKQTTRQDGSEVDISDLVTDNYLVNYKSSKLKFNQFLKIYRTEVSSIDTSKQVHLQVDQMPRIPGCEQSDDCSQRKLVEYIVANLKYPKSAQLAGIEGLVLTQYVVDENGKMKNIEVVRNVSNDCDNASKTLLEKMAQEVTWIPGKLDGEKVNVKMTLPIKFELADTENSENFALHQNTPNPFDDRTKIKFQMPEDGEATLNFYNIQGEIVKSIENRYTEGIHEIELTAEDLGIIGLLYYQLEVGKQKTTRKMIIKERR